MPGSSILVINDSTGSVTSELSPACPVFFGRAKSMTLSNCETTFRFIIVYTPSKAEYQRRKIHHPPISEGHHKICRFRKLFSLWVKTHAPLIDSDVRFGDSATSTLLINKSINLASVLLSVYVFLGWERIIKIRLMSFYHFSRFL